MVCSPIPMCREEFIKELREEFEYTEEEIALELKKVEEKIQERNLTTQEEIKMAYGEACCGCSVREYYASQEPDYFDFDKRCKQALKEMEEELNQQKHKEE